MGAMNHAPPGKEEFGVKHNEIVSVMVQDGIVPEVRWEANLDHSTIFRGLEQVYFFLSWMNSGFIIETIELASQFPREGAGIKILQLHFD